MPTKLYHFLLFGIILLSKTTLSQQVEFDKGTLDTLHIYFLGGYKYDKVILFSNSVQCYKNILYSNDVNEYANEIDLPFFHQDSILLDLVLFEANYAKGFNYNLLWFPSDEIPTESFLKPVLYKYMIHIVNGKYIGFALVKEMNSTLIDKSLNRYSKMKIEKIQSKTRFILD